MILLIVTLFSPSLAIYIRESNKVPGDCFSPTLDNGWVEAEPNILGNNFVGKFRCNSGFVLTGEETIKCRGGVWSSRPEDFPVCAALSYCDAKLVPRIARNGFHQQISYSANSIYRYKCNRGYHLVGPSSAYCTHYGWSVDEAPVCTKYGCDEKELLVDAFEYGKSKSLYKGAVYRFTCFPGAVMVGSPTVYCDGESWNGTKPECLAAPPPPSLSVIIDGVQKENPAVSVGEKVTLACQNLGGSPAPSIAFYLNSEKVGKEARVATTYNFIAEKHHDGARISCAASNKAVQTPVSSLYQVLTIKYASSATYIQGEDTVNSGDYAQYTCTSDVSNPASNMSVNVSDQNGEDLPIVVKKRPIMKARKGFTSSISFGILYREGVEHVQIECKAENEIGEAFSTFITRVQYTGADEVFDELSTLAEITGKTSLDVEKIEEPVIFNKNKIKENENRVNEEKQASAFKTSNEVKDHKSSIDYGRNDGIAHLDLVNDDYANYAYESDSNKRHDKLDINDSKTMKGINKTNLSTKDIKTEVSNVDETESDNSNEYEENSEMIQHEPFINIEYYETYDEKHYGLEEEYEDNVDHEDGIEMEEEDWINNGWGKIEPARNEEYDDSSDSDNGVERDEENWNNINNGMVKLEPVMNEDSVDNGNGVESDGAFWNNIRNGMVKLEPVTSKEYEDTVNHMNAVESGQILGINREISEKENIDQFKTAVNEYEYNSDASNNNGSDQELLWASIPQQPIYDEYYEDGADASQRFVPTVLDEKSKAKSQSSEYHNRHSNKDIIEEPEFSQSEVEASHMALKSSSNFENQAEMSSKSLFSVSSGRRIYFQPILISLSIVFFTKFI